MNPVENGQEPEVRTARRVIAAVVLLVILTLTALSLAGNLTVRKTVTGETEQIHGFGTNI